MFHSCVLCQSARPTVSASPATSSSTSPEPRTYSASSRLMLSMRFLSVPGSARSRLPKSVSTGGAKV